MEIPEITLKVRELKGRERQAAKALREFNINHIQGSKFDAIFSRPERSLSRLNEEQIQELNRQIRKGGAVKREIIVARYQNHRDLMRGIWHTLQFYDEVEFPQLAKILDWSDHWHKRALEGNLTDAELSQVGGEIQAHLKYFGSKKNFLKRSIAFQLGKIQRQLGLGNTSAAAASFVALVNRGEQRLFEDYNGIVAWENRRLEAVKKLVDIIQEQEDLAVSVIGQAAGEAKARVQKRDAQISTIAETRVILTEAKDTLLPGLGPSRRAELLRHLGTASRKVTELREIVKDANSKYRAGDYSSAASHIGKAHDLLGTVERRAHQEAISNAHAGRIYGLVRAIGPLIETHHAIIPKQYGIFFPKVSERTSGLRGSRDWKERSEGLDDLHATLSKMHSIINTAVISWRQIHEANWGAKSGPLM